MKNILTKEEIDEVLRAQTGEVLGGRQAELSSDLKIPIKTEIINNQPIQPLEPIEPHKQTHQNHSTQPIPFSIPFNRVLSQISHKNLQFLVLDCPTDLTIKIYVKELKQRGILINYY